MDLCRTGFAWSLRQAKRLAALPTVAHVYAQKSLSRRGSYVDSPVRKGHRKGEAGLSRERKPSGSTQARSTSGRHSRRRCARSPVPTGPRRRSGCPGLFVRVVEDVLCGGGPLLVGVVWWFLWPRCTASSSPQRGLRFASAPYCEVSYVHRRRNFVLPYIRNR